jgi:hypothetical protein
MSSSADAIEISSFLKDFVYLQGQIMSDPLAPVVLQVNEFAPQISGHSKAALAPSIPAWKRTKTATHGYWCRLMAKEPPSMD